MRADMVSEPSMPPGDDARDLAVIALAVDGRLAEEDDLSEKHDELDAFDRRNGALTERRADETDCGMPWREGADEAA